MRILLKILFGLKLFFFTCNTYMIIVFTLKKTIFISLALTTLWYRMIRLLLTNPEKVYILFKTKKTGTKQHFIIHIYLCHIFSFTIRNAYPNSAFECL